MGTYLGIVIKSVQFFISISSAELLREWGTLIAECDARMSTVLSCSFKNLIVESIVLSMTATYVLP